MSTGTESRVLIVDDEQYVLETASEILAGENYSVIVCSNADDAMVKMQEDNIDIVLTDIKMPGISGIDLLDTIRKDHPLCFVNNKVYMVKSYLMKPKVLEVVERVHSILKGRGLTLSVAESCTGGLISHYVTLLPGASTFFSAGIVSYAEEAKINILHISPGTVSKYGIVSEETAREMAEKVRLLAHTDYSVSTTGNLGPDVLEEKERGLVHIAAAGQEKTVSDKVQLHGSREENKEEAAVKALQLLIKLVEEL